MNKTTSILFNMLVAAVAGWAFGMGDTFSGFVCCGYLGADLILTIIFMILNNYIAKHIDDDSNITEGEKNDKY